MALLKNEVNAVVGLNFNLESELKLKSNLRPSGNSLEVALQIIPFDRFLGVGVLHSA
eukprot:CAMPEP_0119322914 /NCGR_PEP_ID=MMETSP1333-20130426/59497_1 /TAXON_ID=418940 /ORGANISM="Scyphosphaera apsteinii, Strain RCC1455" /LENGTH=56 /DNA_ID=CAMNT_0007330249 /DNA_START=1 /DNA_END=167 /DNA_ORIENTATION=+